MVKIELDTVPRFNVDIDVLASAVYNAAKYSKNGQRIVKFHFHKTAPIERERIKGIVCLLAKLEAWDVKLHVVG